MTSPERGSFQDTAASARTVQGARPIVVIACRVLQDMLERILPTYAHNTAKAVTTNGKITFMDYGLHLVPKDMTIRLQEAIDSIQEPSLILLGYGLCGNGLKGLRSGPHILLAPRTDDCIALLLGSYEAYIREFQAVPGTYYLTKGWLESGSNPLQEYREYAARYGAKEAQWLMDQQYQHYERLMLVAHSQADLEKYRPQAQEIARYCERWGMRYEEMLGSEAYVQQFVELAHNGLGQTRDKDFVIVPPGGEIRQDMFMR